MTQCPDYILMDEESTKSRVMIECTKRKRHRGCHRGLWRNVWYAWR